MSKRFIDTEIFNDPWFMDLSKDAKVLWIYAITNCNHAGILKVNEKLIEFQTKIKSFLNVSKELANCLVRLNESDRYIIPKFFKFQYPNYPEKTFRAADSAVCELIKYNLWDVENHCILNNILTVSKDLAKSPSNSNGISKGNSNSIIIRCENFKKEVGEFDKYDKPMLENFINYWIEPNKTKTKMRFELQKTWSTKLRLITWNNNSNSFSTGQKKFDNLPDSPDPAWEKKCQPGQLELYWEKMRNNGYEYVNKRWQRKS